MKTPVPSFECCSVLEPKHEQFENPGNIVNPQLVACLVKANNELLPESKEEEGKHL